MEFQEDLGFTFNKSKNGDVIIKRRGVTVTRVSGKKAIRFTEELVHNCFAKQQ